MSASEKMNDEKKTKTADASFKLENILGFGRFQVFQVYVYAGLACFLGAMNIFQLIFMVTKKPFRCALPDHLEQR